MFHPWYRSRLFWFGLPGVVFLLWVGLQNERLHIGCAFKTSVIEVEIAPEGTRLSAISDVPHGKLTPGCYSSRAKAKPSFRLTPVVDNREFPLYPGWYQEIKMNHWFISLSCSSLWVLLLIHHQRRKARLLNGAAAHLE